MIYLDYLDLALHTGKRAAMLCTASVEEVIDEHYKNQIDQIEVDEKD